MDRFRDHTHREKQGQKGQNIVRPLHLQDGDGGERDRRDGKRRLYRATHGTFEDYCVARWGMKRNYANKLVAAAEAVRSLPPEMVTIVTNESQAREIASVPAPERAAVVEKAIQATGYGLSLISTACKLYSHGNDATGLRLFFFRIKFCRAAPAGGRTGCKVSFENGSHAEPRQVHRPL